MIDSGLPKGTQVVYVPQHILDSWQLSGADVSGSDLPSQVIEADTLQFGFISSEHPSQDFYFVRYWDQQITDLITKANSQLTPRDNLFLLSVATSVRIDEMIMKYAI